jgi:hypothetical protein
MITGIIYSMVLLIGTILWALFAMWLGKKLAD